MSQAKVFTNVNVFPAFTNGTTVEWFMHSRFTPAGVLTYTLEMSRDPDADNSGWRTIDSLTDSSNLSYFSLLDSSQRSWSVSEQAYYRIKVDVPAVGTFYSYPEGSWGSLQRRERLQVRELFRREEKKMIKHTGVQGWLLRRKSWGTPCPEPGCRNPDTNEVSDSRCPVCYGTGIVGGYHTPISTWIDLRAGRNDYIKRDGQRGTTTDGREMARMLCCPTPRTNDIFVDKTSNERYLIRNVQTAIKMRGVAVVVNAQINELPPTSVLYDIPTS